MTTASLAETGKRTAKSRGDKILFFRTGEHLCGIPIAGVVRILQFQHVTPLPSSQPQVMGMLNLQGRILPVLDMAMRMSRRTFQPDDNACIVVVQAERDGKPIQFGIAVEEVLGVQDISPSEIQPPPPGLDGIDLSLVKGITGSGSDLRLLIEVEGICKTQNQDFLPPHLAQELHSETKV